MSDAGVLEFFEIVQDSLAEGSLVVAELGIFVLQINDFRLLELVIKEVTVGESDLDHRRVMQTSQPEGFQAARLGNSGVHCQSLDR
jgi:hypothetical protein